jgi:hypothetical protein
MKLTILWVQLFLLAGMLAICVMADIALGSGLVLALMGLKVIEYALTEEQ